LPAARPDHGLDQAWSASSSSGSQPPFPAALGLCHESSAQSPAIEDGTCFWLCLCHKNPSSVPMVDHLTETASQRRIASKPEERQGNPFMMKVFAYGLSSLPLSRIAYSRLQEHSLSDKGKRTSTGTHPPDSRIAFDHDSCRDQAPLDQYPLQAAFIDPNLEVEGVAAKKPMANTSYDGLQKKWVGAFPCRQ
jgi:hypothetical protein